MTDTIGRYKNLNLKPKNMIGQLKNRNNRPSQSPDTKIETLNLGRVIESEPKIGPILYISRYKNRNLKSEDGIDIGRSINRNFRPPFLVPPNLYSVIDKEIQFVS